MKWYSKQLKSLNISQGTPSEGGKVVLPNQKSVNSLGGKKIPTHIKNFRNPVAETKRSRSKTDK